MCPCEQRVYSKIRCSNKQDKTGDVLTRTADKQHGHLAGLVGRDIHDNEILEGPAHDMYDPQVSSLQHSNTTKYYIDAGIILCMP